MSDLDLQPPAPPAPTPAPAPKPKTVAVRVLVDCQYGRCNKRADIPAGELKLAKAAGLVDDHAAAVAVADPA